MKPFVPKKFHNRNKKCSGVSNKMFLRIDRNPFKTAGGSRFPHICKKYNICGEYCILLKETSNENGLVRLKWGSAERKKLKFL